MAHTYGRVAVPYASGAADPVTFSLTIDQHETVVVLFLKTDINDAFRAGGAPSWGTSTFTQAGQAKWATSSTAAAEIYYLLNPTPGTTDVSVPNTTLATVHYEVVTARATPGRSSAVDVTITNSSDSATNPTATALVTTWPGDAVFAVTVGNWATWAPSGQAGTAISNSDDGATGYGSQYAMQAALGSITMNWTFGTAGGWGVVAAAFKELTAQNFNNYKGISAGDGISVGEKIR